MSEHSRAHEDRLSEWLESGADVHARLAGSDQATCAGCVALLEELSALERRFGAAREHLQATVKSAIAEIDDEDRATVDRWAERMGLGVAPQRSRVRWVWASAAALLVAWGLWSLRPEPPASGSDPGVLGTGQELSAVEPSGTVAEWGRFRWEGPLPDHGSFEVVVWSTDAGRREVDRSGALTDHHWSPLETSRWGSRIEWEVRSFDASGVLVDSARATAQL